MADPDPSQAKVLTDEKEQHDVKGVSSSVEPASAGPQPTPTSATSNASSHFSPPTSPPDSPPDARKHSTIEEYYSSRPKHDKFGNPIPDRRRPQGAMSSVFGSAKVRLPGDLGPNDPRRPRSPAPGTLPGDLGANDPRRPSSRNVSPAPSGHSRQGSDPLDSPSGRRILKDPKPPPAPESEPAESDQDGDADNDTDNDNGSARGRQKKRPEPGRTTSGKAVNVRGDSADSEIVFPQFQGERKPDPTKGESSISFKLTTPAEKEKLKKRVHPMSAFDSAPSGYSTPLGSDDESHIEMLAAQKLSLTMSAVHSTPSAHRVIRQIIRGDYSHFQREAEEGRKRQRMYLVATDISPEAEYALEWTIGTVLRDGDTLFAVYAADEEAASEGGVEIGHGAENVKDTARIIRDLPAMTNAVPQSAGPSPLAQSAVPGEGPGRVHGSAEAERRRAVEDITERCVRLLRKTRLQVRVVVEVFHCKSPRHMITELIDFLSPTLVIIGSRGRSAVKGVLLGSFSNYLVTKSSVPVMVARKKLRKHSKTVRNRDGTTVPYSGITGRAGRLSNVIEAPKGKGLRVQGWDKVGID
jgi:nucleotide-binding universal stress UspA family protein